MGVEREDGHRQRQHRRPRTFLRLRRGITPCPPCQRGACQPEQQPDRTGFTQHFQHQLVCVQCGALAPGGTFSRVRIARRVRLAKAARADAVDRMRRDHAGRGGPYLGAPGQRGIHAGFIRGEGLGGAHDAVAELHGRYGQQAQDQTAGRKHAQQPTRTQQPPAGCQQHERVSDPARTGAGQQYDQADRASRQAPSQRIQPARRCEQQERRQASHHQAQLEIAGAEETAEPVDGGHFFHRAHRPPADELLQLVQAPEQRAGAGHHLRQRIQGPDAHDHGQTVERNAARLRVGDRCRDQPQERQVAKIHGRLAQRAPRIDGIDGRDGLRQPVGGEQRAGQRPGRAAQQPRASAETVQQQAHDGGQRTQHHHSLGIARCRPQRDERQHPRGRPAPPVGASLALRVSERWRVGGHRRDRGSGRAWRPAWRAGCRRAS